MQDPPKAKKMPKKEIKKESTHLVVLYMQHASCIPGRSSPRVRSGTQDFVCGALLLCISVLFVCMEETWRLTPRARASM